MKQQFQRESSIERKCKLLAQQKGWFQVKIEKTSVRGFPDRLFIRDGKTMYVEFKNEVGRLSDEQVRVIAQMRERGADVYVISSMEEANAIFS